MEMRHAHCMDEDEFGRLVEEALDSLPPELGRMMRNVAIVVEDEGASPNLLGLYHGVPLTSRSRRRTPVCCRTASRSTGCRSSGGVALPKRWRNRCGSPSYTRSPTTSASTTNGSTSSA